MRVMWEGFKKIFNKQLCPRYGKSNQKYVNCLILHYDLYVKVMVVRKQSPFP